MAVDYSRIHRLLKILTLIQGAKGWTAKRLAMECSTTERTIYRDMKMLEGAGVPYFFDEEARSYAVRRDFFLPPVQLTVDEALALSVLAEHIGGNEQVPFVKAASRAIDKVRGQLPLVIRNELEQIDGKVAIRLAAASPPEASADVYETVRAALAGRMALKCEYDALGKPGGGTFIFKPYTLLFSQRSWYAIGHHSQRRAVRTLKLNRFVAIAPTRESYEIPREFSIDKHLGNAWRMIRGDKSHDVELTFDADFAETIADTHWHRTQGVEWNEDGTITFTAKVDGLDEIIWWIMSMGPHCVVNKPLELAKQVKSLAAEIIEKYPKL